MSGLVKEIKTAYHYWLKIISGFVAGETPGYRKAPALFSTHNTSFKNEKLLLKALFFGKAWKTYRTRLNVREFPLSHSTTHNLGEFPGRR